MYSQDYAPLQHLKAKTRYLLNLESTVMLIFVLNKDPHESYFGTGAFRHIECEQIKILKENLRNQFNPKKNGQRTEEHVIHASDNESQTHNILTYLGYKSGINLFETTSNSILSTPHHLPRFNSFLVKMINHTQLFCSLLTGVPRKYQKKTVPINLMPQFLYLMGNKTAYKEYLNTFQGTLLRDYYSLNKLMTLADELDYLEPPHRTDYVTVKEFEPDKFVVLDGVHRASILVVKGIVRFPVAVVR